MAAKWVDVQFFESLFAEEATVITQQPRLTAPERSHELPPGRVPLVVAEQHADTRQRSSSVIKCPDVFVSYDREEIVKEFVRKLKKDLETEKLSVWLDVDDIPPGSTWPKEIGVALRECKALIAIVTRKYVSSQYCKSELCVARGNQKPIFPLIREDGWDESDDGRGVHFMIATSNWAMFRPNDDYGDSLQRLVVGLKGMEGGTKQATCICDTDTQLKKKKSSFDPNCRRFVKLILKLSSILSRDRESDALVLGHMKLALATLKGQDESIGIDPEVYRGTKTVQEFFEVMSKYWNCYADHDLLVMVIEATENEKVIEALHCFLQSKDPGTVIPLAKCPDVPFCPAYSGSETGRRLGTSAEVLKEENGMGDPPQRLEGRNAANQQKFSQNKALELPKPFQDELPPEQNTTLLTNSTLLQHVDTNTTHSTTLANTSQQNDKGDQFLESLFAEEAATKQRSSSVISRQPQLIAPELELSEGSQHFHHHPEHSHELPPGRVPLVVEVSLDHMTCGMYDCLKDVVSSVLKTPREALSLLGAFKGSCILVWHVSEQIAAGIKRILLSPDDQEMLLQCAVMKMSCGEDCLFNISEEELEEMVASGMIPEEGEDMGRVRAITSDEEFERVLKQAGESLVVVDFTADWCLWSVLMNPKFAELSEQYTEAEFLSVDTEECEDTAAKYDVDAVPMFAFFRMGKLLHKFSGADPEELEAKLKHFLEGSEAFFPRKGHSLLPKEDPDTKDVTPTAERGGMRERGDTEREGMREKGETEREGVRKEGHESGEDGEREEAGETTKGGKEEGGGKDAKHEEEKGGGRKSALPPLVTIDHSLPTTSVKIRLADGSGLIEKFNHSHTIGDIHHFISHSQPCLAAASYIFMTAFPTRELTDSTQTLADANLLNAVIIQKMNTGHRVQRPGPNCTTTGSTAGMDGTTVKHKGSLNAELQRQVLKAMQDEKTISCKPVSLVLMGTPRSGKSTILQRLINGVQIVVDPTKEQSSTPLAGEPLRIEIKHISPKLAIVERRKWIKHKYSGEKQLLVSYFLQRFPPMLQDSPVSPVTTVATVPPIQVDKRSSQPKGTTHQVKINSVATLPAANSESPPSSSESPATSTEAPATIQLHKQPQSADSELSFESPSEILNIGEQAEHLEEVEDATILHLLDTGGQPEFLDVLPAILTGPSLDLLVFKLNEELSERYVVKYSSPEGEPPAPYVSSFTVEETLLQSFTSVSNHAPPQRSLSSPFSVSTQSSTLIVGTHKDCVKDEKIKEIDERLTTKFKEVDVIGNQLIERVQDLSDPNSPKYVFAIDNTKIEDSGLPDLQEAIENTLEKHFPKLRLPLKWLMLYLAIQSAKKRVLSLQQCRSIASSCGITNENDLKLALWYLSHQFGVIRYYADVEGLQETIICDLQVLFNCITRLIAATCYQKCAGKEEANLRRYGRCSATLLHQLLRCCDDLSTETTITILEHMRVITPVRDVTSSLEYFIACVLRMFPVEMITATQKAHPAPLLVSFEKGYCPLGLFSQLVVYLASSKVKGWKLKSTWLFRNIVTFRVSSGDDVDEVTLIARPKFYEVLFEREGCDSQHCQPLHDSCVEIRKTIDTAIDMVKSGLNSTIQIRHAISFYCIHRRCNPCLPHSAELNGRAVVCSVTENHTLQNHSQRLWFGEACCEQRSLQQVHTDDQILEESVLDDLTKELDGVRRWFDVGLLLGLCCTTLVEIKGAKWQDISSCRRNMIWCWLMSHDHVAERGGPTVRSLVTVLCNPLVGCPDIANRVEQRFSEFPHCKIGPAPPLAATPCYTGMKLGDRPSLIQLLKFETKENIIDISTQISTDYKKLGIFLLQDDNGAKVNAIELKHRGVAQQINLDILCDWISGKGLKPVTWETLISVLNTIGLNSLADIVKQSLH